MSEPFVGEVRAVGFAFAPRGWALCNGQLMPIGQNQALFSILGTTYGGDGVQTFALPNLQARSPLHAGQKIALGQIAGVPSVTLQTSQIPHGHMAFGTDAANQPLPAGNLPGTASQTQYGTAIDTKENAGCVGPAGGGNPHNNIQPSLVVNFVIALVGIFPSRS